MPRGRKPSATEAIMFLYGKVGQVFFSTKEDKNITAIAGYYKRKVQTQRVFIVEYTLDNPVAKTYTKVTLGDKY